MSPSNCTRKAVASDWMSFEMLPGVIVSESPDTPARASCGSAHRGPCTRGKRMKKTSISGTACTRSSPAGTSLSRTVGVRPTPRW